MPHLILEMSSNILEKEDLAEFFKTCHLMLSEKLPSDIRTFKSRAIIYDTYYIGNGESNQAFIHITLKILAGRNSDVLDEVGDKLLEKVETYFLQSKSAFNLQITIEIIELQKTYFKG